MTAHAQYLVLELGRRNHQKLMILGQSLSMQLTMYDTIAFAEMMDKICFALRGLRIAAVVGPENAKSR